MGMTSQDFAQKMNLLKQERIHKANVSHNQCEALGYDVEMLFEIKVHVFYD